jgi:NTE family protein
MEAKYFTENSEVQEIIRKIKAKNLIVSDVLDEEGNQYVDLVQEGGGVLGIALLGYTYVLEQVGIRFFSLAGTSAGAINTMLLAAVDNIEKSKTHKIIDIIANKNLYDFVDGPFFVKLLLKAVRTSKEDKPLLLKAVKKLFKILWTLLWILFVIIYAVIKKGMNPGKNFNEWLASILSDNNIKSTRDLIKLRRKPEGIVIRPGIIRDASDLSPKLKIITAEITTETRVIFPEMNYLFWNITDDVNPSVYVRASMSIPIFFHPLKVSIGSDIKKEDWLTCVKYKGDLPPNAFFVDGGILSNFPIDVFHNQRNIPRLPTLGVKLGDDRNKASNVGSIMKFLMAIFNSARHVLDYQFLLKNEDYEHLIQKIDIGEHNWLDFSMPDEDKLDLFIRGAKAADEFLGKFNWEEYKEIRAKLIKDGLSQTAEIPIKDNIENN